MDTTNERFDVVFETRTLSELTRILRDRQTGVCYLFHQVGAVGGLTVLLDAEGRPMLDAPSR
ncbi:DUF6440 family protein [Cellulomonas sp. PhB143]|uniref:DUF6440 family protein n=1 Tax=Cellulomonas sp. PhB143 TaxID=2485186 RepID=UPI000F49BA92|nr:DUF6440 family protein [Cellulomonas sp. PhB143]